MNLGGAAVSETSLAGGPMIAGAPPVYLALSEALVVYCTATDSPLVYCQAADFLV
jgi:hypothetical protein